MDRDDRDDLDSRFDAWHASADRPFDWDDGPEPLPWWWVAAVAGGVLAGTLIFVLWLAIRVVR